MKALPAVWNWLKKDLERNKSNIKMAKYFGLWAHPLYYFIWTVIYPQPYESPFFRFASAAACLSLFSEKWWPHKIKPLFDVYWYLGVTLYLPITFTYLTLMNNFSGMWLVCETMMIFVVVIFIPNLLLMSAILGGGMAIAYGCFVANTGTHLIFDQRIIEYLLPVPMAMTCGIAFSFATRKGILAQEKNETLVSLGSSIAHEMRNPLGQIQQSLDEIEAQLPSPSPTERETVLFHEEVTACYDSLGRGQSAIRRGLQVITTTLNEIKGKQIETEEFVYLSARTSTEKAVAEYGYETHSERNKVQVCGNDDFFFKGDETLYQFVLFNLIKNALFYMKTHPDAEVTIRFQSAEESNQNMNRVIVKDTGPGIPKAVLSNLFKSFYSSGKKSGTGLGLAYCKRVMVAFGGDIHCESVEGNYTEFILSFPNVSEADVEAAQRRMIDAAQAQLHGKRVLLVDDMEGIRQMTRMHLEPFAMQVDEAEGGEQAINQLQKADYDLVILDLRMPVMDGYRAAELIRSGTCFSEGQCRNYLSLPILALTAEVSYLAQVKTEKVGITHFQSKPCTQIALIQALRTTLEKAAQQKRTAATPLKGKSVLVVDDSAQNRTVLIHNLKPQGVHVIEAETGEAALTLLDQMPCDLILMDVHMPGIDGLETVRRLRSGRPFSQFKNYGKIPIIALSGDEGEEERAAALSAGMNDYLTKPIQREALLNTLTRWFSAHSQPVAKLVAEAPVASEKSAPKKQDDLDYLPLLDEGSLARTQAWDPDHAKRLYGYFVAGVEERLEKLETAWEARDMEDFNFHMHTLQGNPGNILAERFPKLVQRMYTTVKQGEWPTESLDYLRKVFVETHQAMKEEIF